jgi:type IV pilus assembly protein PilM
MPKGATAIGIEIETQAIRAACISPSKADTHASISAIEEIIGTFVTDEQIIEGLRTLRKKMDISFADSIVTCVSGKQVYAAQMTFKKLPDEELRNALKFEIRKNLPFDTSNATIEFQSLSASSKKNELMPLMVTAVANPLLQKTLQNFEEAGLPPSIIDIFPLTVANSLWTSKSAMATSPGTAQAILHIGPEFSTVVIDGENVPFFTRTIHFNPIEAATTQGQPSATQSHDLDRKISAFTEEIARSLAFYRTSFKTHTAATLLALGGHATTEILARISRDTGLSISTLDLISELDARQTAVAGKFEIAIILGLRGLE